MMKLLLPIFLVSLLVGCTVGNEVSTPVSTISAPVPTLEKAAEAIRIQPAELLLSAGGTASLVCESTSGQPVNAIWSIDNESIATITDDGTVTAVAKGETTAKAELKGAPEHRATCLIKVVEPKALAATGAKIEINDEEENFIAQDGTKCNMFFEMQAVNDNGVFKGQAMLRSVGVKDAGASIPATAMVELVSTVEFSLEPSDSEEPPTIDVGGNAITLEPLIHADFCGKGTFGFILTDVGFMALETKVTDDDVFLEVPFEVIVVGDTVGIGFLAPDGQLLSFQGTIR